MIYLDHNATTPIAPEVREVILPYLGEEWGNPSSTFHGIESEALLILLDQGGICASSGSACLADSDEPSHVVKAIKPESAASRQMIRFSLGLENTGDDVQAILNAIAPAVRMLRG
jgi:cysteine desulfurase